MPIRNARPLLFRPRTVCDAVDGTNVPAGALSAAANLIPAPHTADLWVPRPAAILDTAFSGFSSPGQVELLAVFGTRAYGLIASARNPGRSEPFVYDLAANAFVTVSGITAGNTPSQQPATGDWTPAAADQVGGYVIVAHPGFGLPNAFGWFDMTGIVSNTITGNTHGTATINSLSANALTAGWRPGMTIIDSSGDIPAGTTIVSIAANGLSATLSAAATGTNAGATFTVAGGTYAAPLWAAGNLNENPLVAVATGIAQYAGSACYAVNTVSPPSAAVVFSDAGDPLRSTNAGANQVVTFRNSIPVTKLAPLPLYNVTGGIIQSLIAVQKDSGMQQLTGTPVLSNLQVNALTDSVGSLAPNSFAATPQGLLFIAPDGMRSISFTGQVSEVIGQAGAGVVSPFIYAETLSRICAAYNEDVYRVSVTAPAFSSGTPSGAVATVEYWYHLGLKKWSGPHSFPAALIAATESPHGYVMAPALVIGSLWQSDALPNANSVFVENGQQMTATLTTSLLPSSPGMNENAVTETTVSAAIIASQTLAVSAVNEQGTTLATASIQGVFGSVTTWGSFTWGSAPWGGAPGNYRKYRVPWPNELVFNQMTVSISTPCGFGTCIGNIEIRYQELGYIAQGAPLYA